ncbi:MAG: FAD-dependent oxidoreductase [Chloroflexota bacterium]
MNKGVLIIGGSLAGTQAAMDLADAGNPVHLIEPSPFLVNSDGQHLLRTRLLEVARHANITVWTNTQLNRAEKKPGRLHVELRRHPRYVDLSKCTACGKCVEVCPVTVPGTNHKAIYIDSQPGCMAIVKEGKPPCANTCPGGIHVQGYVALIAQGRFQEAIDLVQVAIPFPGICGRVCTHPCEFNCRRAEFDAPVAVRLLKRFVADWELSQGRPAPASKGEDPDSKADRVAIVGAGPGGMAVADRLARLGYQVTVFEKLPVIGGMMAVGIPEYRLPGEVIAREYRQIQELGVEVRLNTAIGPGGEFTLDDLFDQGYRAVCLAIGAHRSQNLHIPGEELPGVVHGIDLLQAINLSQRIDDPGLTASIKKMIRRGKSTRVAVLGGGNTAMDVSRSLKRLGVRDVRILYRRTRTEMPAMAEEIEDAEHEGVGMEFLVSPVRLLGDAQAGVNGLECIRMKLGEPDASGRRRPVPIAGSEFVVDLDMVVLAIGQSPDLSFLGEEHAIAITRNERINVADVSFMTSRPGVFAVGDAVTSDKMVVIEAIGMGKQAAASIDMYLRGLLPKEIVVDDREVPIARRELSAAERVPVKRTRVATIPLSQRRTSFAEVELGYTAEQAVAEARRCLACGPCSECQACVQVCQPGAITHDQCETFSDLDVAAILIAAEPPLTHLPPLPTSPAILHIEPHDPLAASAAAAQVMASLPTRTKAQPLTDHPAPEHPPARIGVFLCQCGDEIARIIDNKAVHTLAAGLPGVAHTQTLPFACSSEAARSIHAAVEDYHLDGAVLAACSCCSLDQVCFSCTFQRIRCKGNLGLFTQADGHDKARTARFEFVNIREQCAWVHADDPAAATSKAASLIAATVASLRTPSSRAALAQPQERTALILGRGTAAAVCKKMLARQGISAVVLRKPPAQVRRAAGQFIVQKGDQSWMASTLVLAPRDAQEAGELQAAFVPQKTAPRGVPSWGGVDTHRPGVFFCDPERDPALTGAAAAGRLAAWLGRVQTRLPAAAIVDPQRCRSCSTCVETCEFGAPSLMVFAKDRIYSWIDPAICTGCGTCAARCPSGAITAGYSSDAEIQAMLKAFVT